MAKQKAHNDHEKSCYNCGHEFKDQLNFCPVCGQKREQTMISAVKLLSTFFASLFNIDNKTIKSTFNLFIPGKLTSLYFKGKRASYTHPLRMYFFLSFILFALIGYQFNSEVKNSDLFQRLDNRRDLEQKRDIALLDSLSRNMAALSPNIDYGNGGRAILYQYVGEKQDSFGGDTISNDISKLTFDAVIPPELPTLFLDSILLIYANESPEYNRMSSRMDSIVMTELEPDSISPGRLLPFVKDSLANKRFALEDLLELPTDSIYTKYKVNHYWEKLYVGQATKIVRQPGNALLYVLSGFSWVALLFIPFFAFWLKLIYLRRRRYFIEHLVFTIHTTSFLFLLVLIYFLILGLGFKIALALYFLYPLYVLLAMRNYYQQNWFKSIVKFIFSGFIAVLLVQLLFILSIVVRIALF